MPQLEESQNDEAKGQFSFTNAISFLFSKNKNHVVSTADLPQNKAGFEPFQPDDNHNGDVSFAQMMPWGKDQ